MSAANGSAPERLTCDVKDVAVMLGLSKDKVLDLVHERRLRATRVGRRILIPREAVTEFLASAEFTS